jgi:predicted CopG family antitoxin
MTDDTNIRVSGETWRKLDERKGPGDSFDDVIRSVLEQSDTSVPAEQ